MIEIEAGAPAEKRPTFLVENLLEGTTTTVVGGGDIDLATNGTTFDFWEPTINGPFVDFDFGSTQSFNCLCVAAHDLSTQGARIRVVAGSTEVASHTPSDNRAIMVLFPAQTRSDVRIAISGASSPAKIGVMMLGNSMTLPTGIVGDYVPTNWAGRVDVLGGTTISGQFLGQRIIRRGGETRIAPGLIDRDWWTANGDALRERFDEGQPFFFAGGPSLFPDDIAYCWRSEGAEELRPAYSNAHYVAFGMDVNFYA